VLGFAVWALAPLCVWGEEEPVSVAVASKAAATITSTEGRILVLDLDGKYPGFRLSTAGDGQRTVYVDKKTTTVWRNGVSVGFKELKPADKVKVRHMARGGKQVAKTIEIVQ